MLVPISFSSARTTPESVATPPVMTTLSSTPMRETSPLTRPAMLLCIAAITSSVLTLFAKCEITSLSANTVHVELMSTRQPDFSSSAPNCDKSMSSTLAMTDRKRPVPAAHLSFMRNFNILPCGESFITFASCPPISIMVRASGYILETPLLWHESSLS